MKALMCFMYELAPPVWQRLVCCSAPNLLPLVEPPRPVQTAGWGLVAGTLVIFSVALCAECASGQMVKARAA